MSQSEEQMELAIIVNNGIRNMMAEMPKHLLPNLHLMLLSKGAKIAKEIQGEELTVLMLEDLIRVTKNELPIGRPKDN